MKILKYSSEHGFMKKVGKSIISFVGKSIIGFVGKGKVWKYWKEYEIIKESENIEKSKNIEESERMKFFENIRENCFKAPKKL